MVDGKCCPRCPCPCNAEISGNSQSASRRSGGFGGGAGGTGHPLTSTPVRPQASELNSRLEQTRARLETLMASSREMSGGSGGHSNTMNLNELMIMRRKLQILETRVAVLEERMSCGGSPAAGSGLASSRSLETLKRNVIRAVASEFEQF